MCGNPEALATDLGRLRMLWIIGELATVSSYRALCSFRQSVTDKERVKPVDWKSAHDYLKM
jgi:hypothetical protein